jgi:hypothetical protein
MASIQAGRLAIERKTQEVAPIIAEARNLSTIKRQTGFLFSEDLLRS